MSSLSASPVPLANAAPLGRIGIVMLSAVGDAVHVLPLVSAIKRVAPASRISWITQPGPATLVRGHASIDEIIPFDRAKGWRAFADAHYALRDRPFDTVLALQDYFKAGILTLLARAPVKLGYDRARARDANWLFTNKQIAPHAPQHVQDEYLEFLGPLGVSAEPLEWGLGPWPEERSWQRSFAEQVGGPFAALVIGSSRPDKDWLPDRWAAIAESLDRTFGLRPVIVGGPSPREAATAATIVQRVPRAVNALNSGLRRLVCIIDAATLVVSLDTGPLHVAVALKRPVVSLLGFSNPRRTGPYRDSHDLVVSAYGDEWNGGKMATDRRPGRMPGISVDDVLGAVQRWSDRYPR